MYLVLERLSDNGVQTVGKMRLYDSQSNKLLEFDTLELTYDNNKRMVSCVKEGLYVVVPKISFRHGKCFELKNILSRKNILIHTGNFNKDTKGCILIGHGFANINSDLQSDLLNSRLAMSNLLNTLELTTTIEILNRYIK